MASGIRKLRMSQQKTAALLPAAQETSTHIAPARSREPGDHAKSNHSAIGSATSQTSVEGVVSAAGGELVGELLSAIHRLTEALVSPILLTESGVTLPLSTDTVAGSLSQLSSLLNEWRLPELPLNPFARELSLDDSLLRYELAWVHLACTKLLPTVSSDPVAQTAQRFEEMLDRRFLIGGWRFSPFTGLIQAIEIARVAGMISETDSDSAIRGAFASSCRNDAWRILRVSVQHIAAACGFPRWASTSLAAS